MCATIGGIWGEDDGVGDGGAGVFAECGKDGGNFALV